MVAAANIAGATRLYVAIPDAFEAGQIIEQARALNPALKIIARAHSDAEVEHLTGFRPDVVIMGEDQIARAMIEYEMTGTVPEAAKAPGAPPGPAEAAAS
jgi:CPA2 family monovalent cation:H+ antiporter-2